MAGIFHGQDTLPNEVYETYSTEPTAATLWPRPVKGSHRDQSTVTRSPKSANYQEYDYLTALITVKRLTTQAYFDQSKGHLNSQSTAETYHEHSGVEGLP